MEQNKRNKTKIVIIVLAVLLALSLFALAGILIHNHLVVPADTTVTVPDNLITPDEEKNDSTDEGQDNSTAATDGTEHKKIETAITLYNKHLQENTLFSVTNMFPGDRETKYYRVQVSYHDTVTIHFKSEVRDGQENMAEVMGVKVKLITSGETLYEGLMQDMPQSITYTMESTDSTTDEICYEITVFLDTSAGNEYQNKDMILDFRWWVEDTGNLDKAPQMGDVSNIVLCSVIAMVSLFALLILLLLCRKKEDRQYEW